MVPCGKTPPGVVERLPHDKKYSTSSESGVSKAGRAVRVLPESRNHIKLRYYQSLQGVERPLSRALELLGRLPRPAAHRLGLTRMGEQLFE